MSILAFISRLTGRPAYAHSRFDGREIKLRRCGCGGKPDIFVGLDDIQIACLECNNRIWPERKIGRAIFKWNSQHPTI